MLFIADGIYIGGGALFVIILFLVLFLLFR